MLALYQDEQEWVYQTIKEVIGDREPVCTHQSIGLYSQSSFHRPTMILISSTVFSLASMKHCDYFVRTMLRFFVIMSDFAAAAAYLLVRRASRDTTLDLPRRDNTGVIESIPIKKGQTVILDFPGTST